MMNQDGFSSDSSEERTDEMSEIQVSELHTIGKNAFIPIKEDPNDSYGDTMSDLNQEDQKIDTNTSSDVIENDNEDYLNRGEKIDLSSMSQTVTVLKGDQGKTVYLVGTNHFSKKSHEDVKQVIRLVRPRMVMLELCRSRMCIIQMDEKAILEEAKSLNFRKLLDYINKNGFLQGFIYATLLNVSVQITKNLDLAPGGEFRAACQEAAKIPKCTVILGDRPMNITLRRAMACLSLWQKIKMGFHFFFSNEKINEEEVEKYKEKDMLEEMVDELAAEFPEFSKVMVDERDLFLTYSLWSSHLCTEPCSNIVGVVGLGHAAGIKKHWDRAPAIDVDELLRIPKTKPSKMLLFIKYSFYGAMGYCVYRYIIPKTFKSLLLDVGSYFRARISSSLS